MDKIEEDISAAKKGERCVNVRLRRYGKASDPSLGMSATVMAHPQIEALFRGWGDGTVQDVRNYARGGWVPIGGSDLAIYHLRANPQQMVGDDGHPFRIDRPGQPLLEPDANTGRLEVLNMSFLRIAGISNGAGVSFAVKGVFTEDQIIAMAQRIRMAARRLYNQYLRPVDITLEVFTSIQQIPQTGFIEVDR